MALNDPQIAWLRQIAGGAKAADAAGPALAKRTAALDTYIGELDDIRGDLKSASEALILKWPAPEVRRFWESGKEKEMAWSTGDRDEEVDSVHDMVDKFMIKQGDAVELRKLHERVVEIQNRMAAEEGPDGKPMFSTDDIRRELWTPLIEAGVVPSNAVADKYSQEAVVFKGASELYQTKLEEYTKTASHHERAQQVLRIAAAGATMTAAMVKGGMEFGAMGSTDISTKEVMENEQHLKALEQAKESGATDRAAELQKQVDAFNTKYAESKEAVAHLKMELAATTLAFGAVQGALGVAEKMLDAPSEKKAWTVAETALKEIGTSAANAFATWATKCADADPTGAKAASFKTLAAQGPAIIKSAVSGGTLGFRLREAVIAKKPADRTTAIKAMITGVADVMFYAVMATDTASGTSDDGNNKVTGTGGEHAKIAAYVKMALIDGADAVEIGARIKAEYDKSGSFPTGAALAKLLGLASLDVLRTASVASLPTLEEAVRKTTPTVSEQIADGKSGDDIIIDSRSAFTETLTQAISRRSSDGATMSKDADSTASLAKLIDWPSGDDPGEKAKAIAVAQAKQEAAEKQVVVDTLRDKLTTDEEFRQQFIEMLKDEGDKGIEDVLEATRDAMPPPDALAEDPEAGKKAMAAVEKLIAEAAALNSKWKIMTGIAKGGTTALVAALPVAGLASSITQLATDILILVRKSYHVNKWRENMALTYGSGSVYGPSIQRQLDSCYVQVTQQTVVTVLDLVGVAADTLKVADLSGVGVVAGAVGHGLQAGNTMARALTEFGFKMQREADIEAGWQLYQKALEQPGDRKAARKAMRWNTTLAKCVIAYGIVIDKDPIAKEVGRSCGLTPEVLADQKNVCPKVVKYFETLYSDDPVVLRRSPAKKKWHPGTPVLTIDSWLNFKVAAGDTAAPPLAPGSQQTPVIDTGLALLAAAVGDDGDYAARRDRDFPYTDDLLSGLSRGTPEYGVFLDKVETAAQTLARALKSYTPEIGVAEDGDRSKVGMLHKEMAAVVDSLSTQCADILSAVEMDRKEYTALASLPAAPDLGDVVGAVEQVGGDNK